MNKKIWNLILFIIVVGLTAYILKDVDFKGAYYLLGSVDLRFFFLSVIIFPVGLLIWNLRFKYFFRKTLKVKFWFLFNTALAGFFVNTITPGSNFGGEPVRIYYLKKRYDAPTTEIVGAVLADKFFYLSVFFVLSVISLLYLLFFVGLVGGLKVVLELILLMVVFLFAVMLFFHFKRRKINVKWVTDRVYNLKSIKKDFKKKSDFDKAVARQKGIVIRSYERAVKSVLLQGIVLSFLYWVPMVLSAYFLFFAFGSPVGIVPVCIVVILSYFIGDISPSPGGIGLTEGTMLLLYSSMGIDSGLAFAVALLSRIIYYIYYLGIGGICLLYLRGERNSCR